MLAAGSRQNGCRDSPVQPAGPRDWLAAGAVRWDSGGGVGFRGIGTRLVLVRSSWNGSIQMIDCTLPTDRRAFSWSCCEMVVLWCMLQTDPRFLLRYCQLLKGFSPTRLPPEGLNGCRATRPAACGAWNVFLVRGQPPAVEWRIWMVIPFLRVSGRIWELHGRGR